MFPLLFTLLVGAAPATPLAPCSTQLTPLRLVQTLETHVGPSRAHDMGGGWLRFEATGLYLGLHDLSLHRRLPPEEPRRTFTLEGRSFRTLARGANYSLLYDPPLSPILLGRTALLQFGLARELVTTGPVLGRFARAFDFTFSPDERHLAVNASHTIDFVRTEDARLQHRFTTEPVALLASRWMDSRRHLVVAFAERAAFFMFDVETGRSDLLFRHSRIGARALDPVAYLASSSRIAFADNRRDQSSTLHLLDEHGQGASIETPEPVEGLVVAPDGRTFLAHGPRVVRVYDAHDLGRSSELRTTADLAFARYAPDGAVVLADAAGRVVRYELRD